jgi:hypothetical protein
MTGRILLTVLLEAEDGDEGGGGGVVAREEGQVEVVSDLGEGVGSWVYGSYFM